MRKALYAGLAVFAFAVGIATAAGRETSQAVADPMVKILVGQGHGSGFHVGNGYVFTAAHVVDGATMVNILADNGAKDEAEVLWVNTARDVALVKLKTLRPAVDNLSCRVPTRGEHVEAKGNPRNLEFVSTWGQVAGSALKLDPWLQVVPLSVSIVPGQSGGPLYDTSGRVVGMNVGVMVAQVGFSGSLVGIGYAVPGSVLCDLLAKV